MQAMDVAVEEEGCSSVARLKKEEEEQTPASVRLASETRLRDCSLLLKAMPTESLYKNRLQTNQTLLEQNKAMLAQLEQALTARDGDGGAVPVLDPEQRKDVAKKILLVKANLSEILRIYTQELPTDDKPSSSSSSSSLSSAAAAAAAGGGGGGAAISPR